MVALSPGADNDIAIVVIPENAEAASTRVYLLRIRRAAASDSGDAKLDSLTLTRITLSPIFNANTNMYSVDVLDSITSTTVTAMADTTATSVVIMSNRDDDLGPNLEVTSGTPNPANVARHTVELSPGDNVITIMVTAQDYETMETYTVRVIRGDSSNAYLSSLSLTDDMGMDVALVAGVAAHWNTLNCPEMNDRVGADDQPDDMNSPYCRMYDGLDDAAKAVVDQTYEDDPIEGFMSNIAMYYASVDAGVAMVDVMATAMDSAASVSGDGSVSVDAGENTIDVMVTAEDGTTMMTYTVMLTVGDAGTAPGDGVCALYDSSAKGGNGNGMIDVAEAVQAVQDYQNGDLELGDAVQVVLCFQGN